MEQDFHLLILKIRVHSLSKYDQIAKCQLIDSGKYLKLQKRVMLPQFFSSLLSSQSLILLHFHDFGIHRGLPLSQSVIFDPQLSVIKFQ